MAIKKIDPEPVIDPEPTVAPDIEEQAPEPALPTVAPRNSTFSERRAAFLKAIQSAENK
jgi:hypothetical protein